MSTTMERVRTLLERALRANATGLIALAMATAVFGAGCSGEESTADAEDFDSVESVEQEIVGADLAHDGSDAGDDEEELGLPSNTREQESEQGAPSPGELRSEPVPHPWVPKVHHTDNDS